ncbi:hypothetical protein ABZ471_38920 [Streptomyces sp. NPDC005728]|uniref:hypothetical protein n=1 Tax=Streptomyces sp. NPDC005728 TaxID=3157054 RepID=UPI0033FFDBD0
MRPTDKLTTLCLGRRLVTARASSASASVDAVLMRAALAADETALEDVLALWGLRPEHFGYPWRGEVFDVREALAKGRYRPGEGGPTAP